MPTTIRNANLGDLYGIKNLYLDITEKYPDNLTPFTNEVTDDFIFDGLQAALERGYAFVMEKDDEIIGYSKGYTSKNIRKAHILENITTIIRSDYVNGIFGYKLIKEVNKHYLSNMKHIHHMYIYPHIFNSGSIKLLTQLIGAKAQTVNSNAIVCKDGLLADEVMLVLNNNNFSYESLYKYQEYLTQIYSKKSYNDKYQTKYDDLSFIMPFAHSLNSQIA